MVELIHFTATITQRIGPQGGPVWSYRGALIETGCVRTGDNNYLRLSGHPCDGHRFNQPLDITQVIDWWLDGQQSPDHSTQIFAIGGLLQRQGS